MSVVEEIPPERIQGVTLVLIAGFLGAGKTTVLNHLVRSNPGERIGVLVNDFGEIDVDAELIANADGETITLTNGCICCTIKDDLILTMFRLLHRDDPPRQILVECSGVSDPAEVIRSFDDAQLHDIVRVDSIVAVVDAEQLAEIEFHHEPMALHQLVTADLVILNKLDLVDDAGRETVEAKVRSTVPHARILHARRGAVPYELVMGSTRFDPSVLDEHDHDHDHDHSDEFETMAWRGERPLALERLRDALDELPAGIVRAKGIVAVDGFDERQVIVHVAGKRIHLEQGEPWPDGPRHNRLVAIGTTGSFDAQAIADSLTACEVEPGKGVRGLLESWVRKFRG